MMVIGEISVKAGRNKYTSRFVVILRDVRLRVMLAVKTEMARLLSSQVLEEYTFEVQHRPGERHGNADAMSRRPCLNKPSYTACHDVVAGTTTADTVDSTGARPDSDPERHEMDELLLGPHVRTSVLRDGPADQLIGWTKEEIAAAQRDDPDIQFIIGLKEKYSKKPAWKVVEGQSAAVKTLWHEFCRRVPRGSLSRKWTPVYGPNVTLQIIIPRKLRDDFVGLVHSGLIGGHLGRSKTEHQLAWLA